MKTNNLPIGIFDSGIGGLTVLQEFKKSLPNEKFIYYADTAHVPYGNKSKETIEKYCLNIVDFLNEKNVKLIIIACNTASAIALDTIQKHTSTPILNVIDPCVQVATTNRKSDSIGIIGTRTTIISKAYEKKIKRLNNQAKVYSQECSLLVPIIEESLTHHKIAHVAVQLYLNKLPKTLNTLILGCTHYPLIKHIIVKYIKPKINVLDSSIIMAQHVKQFLIETKLISLSLNSTIEFYISDDPLRFREAAFKIIGKFNGKVNKINL